MLYSEIIAVCSQSHTKHINTLCGQNVELLNVKLAVYIVHILRGWTTCTEVVIPPSRTCFGHTCWLLRTSIKNKRMYQNLHAFDLTKLVYILTCEFGGKKRWNPSIENIINLFWRPSKIRNGKMQYYKVEAIQLEGATLLGTPCIAASECPHFPPALTACFMASSLCGKIRFIMLSTFPLNGCINPRKWRCLRTMSLVATSVPVSAAPVWPLTAAVRIRTYQAI